MGGGKEIYKLYRDTHFKYTNLSTLILENESKMIDRIYIIKTLKFTHKANTKTYEK